MGAADDILSNYQHIVSKLELVTGSKGVFDVTVDGEVLFSKHDSGRHALPGEVLELFVQRYAVDTARFGD